MREDISKLSIAYIEQIAALFDGEFKAIDRMIFNIGLENDVESIMNMTDAKTVDNRYTIRSVVKDIQLFSRANRLIESIGLYSKNTNVLIAENSAYYDNLIDLYTIRKYGITTMQFDKLMHDSYSQKVVRLQQWHNQEVETNALIYLQSLPIQSKTPSGGFIVTLDEKSLSDFAEKELFKDSKVLVFSEDNALLYSNDPELYHEVMDTKIMIKRDETKIRLLNKTYIKETITTEYKNWVYVSLVPEEIYYDRLTRARSVVTIIAGLFLLINLFMAYYFTNRMYLPLKKIITSFSNQEKFLEQSEYDYIEQVIHHTIEEQQKMRNDLDKQRLTLKNAFFTKVFKGQIKDHAYMEQQLEYFDVYIGEDGFLLMLIQFIQNESDMKQSLAQFIISNVFEEILSSYVTCQIIEVDGMVACLIQNDAQGILMDEIEEHLQKALELTYQSFELDCIIGFSRIYKYIDGVANAYQESIEAINHGRMNQVKKIIHFDEIELQSNKYEFSVELEYQLIHYIKVGDFTKSLSIINEVIHWNSRKQMPKFSYMQCLMFDLMGAILKSTDHPLFNEMLEEKDPMSHLLKATNSKEMKEILADVTLKACEANSIDEHQNKKFSMKYQIDDYIEKNYSNPDLNVSKLGEVFSITPAYLSKLYKQETGNTILYALNKVRIDASKRLLEETSLSIHDISEKVGYLYSNAFIRFFKNQTGLTPGQYKNLHEHSNHS